MCPGGCVSWGGSLTLSVSAPGHCLAHARLLLVHGPGSLHPLCPSQAGHGSSGDLHMLFPLPVVPCSLSEARGFSLFRNWFDHVPLLLFGKDPPQHPKLPAEQQACLPGPSRHPCPFSCHLCGLYLGLSPQHCLLLVSWLSPLPQSVPERSVASHFAQGLHPPHFLSSHFAPVTTWHRTFAQAVSPFRNTLPPDGWLLCLPQTLFSKVTPWPARTTSLPNPCFLL